MQKCSSLSLKAISYIRNFLGGVIKIDCTPYLSIYYIKFKNGRGAKLSKVLDFNHNKNDTFCLIPVTFGNKYSIIKTENKLINLSESNVVDIITQISQG